MRISEPDLREILKKKEISIKQFCIKMGITRQGAYDLMRRKRVKESMITKISQVLQIDRKEFLIEENMTSDNNINELQKEIQRLNGIIEMKNELIDSLYKTIIMAERFVNSMGSKIARGTSITKNKN